MKPFLSIIVTTYNWPKALAMVLQALARQTSHHFEILIADDGSAPETAEMIKQYQLQLPVVCKHIWQDDDGFRAAAIRNKAILEASGEYLVFLDGDCIPRKDFVEKHAALAETGCFVAGNRILLSKTFSEEALTQKLALYEWSFLHWVWARIRGYSNRCISLIPLPLKSKLRQYKHSDWKGAKGCNLGIFKTDLLRVNGWEERFKGWGYEDSDLVIRLLNAGLWRKEGRFALTVIHLWHTENDRSREQDNWRLLEDIRHSKEIYAKQGLDQHAAVIT